MGPEALLLVERLATHVTLVGLLTGVDEHVLVQLTVLCRRGYLCFDSIGVGVSSSFRSKSRLGHVRDSGSYGHKRSKRSYSISEWTIFYHTL